MTSLMRTRILNCLKESDGALDDPKGHADMLLRRQLGFTSPIGTLRTLLLKMERAKEIHIFGDGWQCERIVVGPNPAGLRPIEPVHEPIESTSQKVEKQERTDDILQLHVEGLSPYKIAERTDIPKTTVRTTITDAWVQAAQHTRQALNSGPHEHPRDVAAGPPRRRSHQEDGSQAGPGSTRCEGKP